MKQYRIKDEVLNRHIHKMVAIGLSSRADFRLPLATSQAQTLITAAYQMLTQTRGREFVLDSDTTSHIAQLALVLTTDNPKNGVILCGGVGSGKTTLMIALQKAINLMNDFTHVPALALTTAKGIANHEPLYARYLERTEPLGIDDLGNEPSEVHRWGNITSPVADILERRYAQRLFTIVSTNLTLEQIKGHYGERVSDRLIELCEIIEFTNPSYRM